LFTSQGEYNWIPDWETTFIFPDQPDTEPGTIFAHVLVPGKTSYWYTVQYDSELMHTIYISITPDIWMMRLDVTCEAGPDDTTVASLDYQAISLSRNGERVLEKLFGEESPASLVHHMEGWINEYLSTGKPVDGKQGIKSHLHGLRLHG
jgi:hypothetical protein